MKTLFKLMNNDTPWFLVMFAAIITLEVALLSVFFPIF